MAGYFYFLHRGPGTEQTVEPTPASPKVEKTAQPAATFSTFVRLQPENASPLPTLQPETVQPARTPEEDTTSRAIKAFNNGDYRKAVRLFEELPDKSGRKSLGLGLSHYKLGDYENAIHFLESAVSDGGDEFMARKFLAFAYYDRDDIDRSLFNAETGLSIKKDPDLKTLYERLKKEKTASDNFIDEGTLHFTALFDGYEHRDLGRRVITILEDAYGSIGAEMNYYPDRPVTVILYTEKDFYDITQVSMSTGGVYDGKIRVPVKDLHKHSDTLLRKVLFHEYTHALVSSITSRCPLWINEGLAEYFSGGYPERIGQVIPLDRLEDSFPRGQMKTAYHESYSAVSYLIETYGIFSIKDLLISLSRGEDINQAFTSAFFITYNDFINEWG